MVGYDHGYDTVSRAQSPQNKQVPESANRDQEVHLQQQKNMVMYTNYYKEIARLCNLKTYLQGKKHVLTITEYKVNI